MPVPAPARWRPVRQITVSDGRSEVSVLAVFDPASTNSFMPLRVHQELTRGEMQAITNEAYYCPTCAHPTPVLGKRVFRVKLPGIFTCCWTFVVVDGLPECRIGGREMGSIGLCLLTATGQPARVFSAKCPLDPLNYGPDLREAHIYTLGRQSCSPMRETTLECTANAENGTRILINDKEIPVHGFLLQPLRQYAIVGEGRVAVKVFNPSVAHRVLLPPGTLIATFSIDTQLPPASERCTRSCDIPTTATALMVERTHPWKKF